MDLIDNQKAINKEFDVNNVNSFPNFERKINERRIRSVPIYYGYYKVGDSPDEQLLDFYNPESYIFVLSFEPDFCEYHSVIENITLPQTGLHTALELLGIVDEEECIYSAPSYTDANLHEVLAVFDTYGAIHIPLLNEPDWWDE